MTQVEIPQLSLGRYVELLKRRRWQLVPVSLLGLLIGGLVAFFIPRYFVAETQLIHSQLPGVDLERAEHPFAEIVDTAKSSIPTAVGETLDALAWPEAMALDGFARDQYERAVEKRVFVEEGNAWEKKRTYAKIQVTYLDRDGERAAAFCNKLVEVWIAMRLRELRQPAQENAQRAKTRADTWLRLLDGLSRDKQDLERTYGILPQVDPLIQQKELAADAELTRKLEKDRRDKGAALAVLEAKLVTDRARLVDTPERVAPDSVQAQAKALASPQGQALMADVLHLQLSLGSFRPGTGPWRSVQRQLEVTQQLLQGLTAPGAASADGLVPNPERAALELEIAAEELQRVQLQAELAQLDQDLEQRRQRHEGMANGWRLYEKKLREIAEAEEQRKAAVAERDAADKAVAQLFAELPVRVGKIAQVPPVPTEPNVLVVALIGCVLGLAAAIGLILLLDFLQGTFKTVDDVERGLSLPVLGGIAHLETADERRVAVRGRRRVSLIAVTMLLLIAVVVGFYYVDPTRLPTFVRDVLQLLLGP